MVKRTFALFDAASRLNRLRASTRPEDKLRGYFHWLALQKDGGNPPPAARRPAYRVFRAGDPERSVSAEVQLDFVPAEQGERRLALSVRLRDRKDFPPQPVACRVYLLEEAMLRRLAERARAHAAGEHTSTASGPTTASLHAGPVRALAGLPDGRIISSGADGTLRLWDPATGSVATFAANVPDLVALAALPDGRVVSADGRGALRLWDPRTGVGRDVGQPNGRVTALAALPDGRIASALAQGPIRLWSPGTGAVQTLELRRAVEALAPLPGGRLLSIDVNGMAQIWDLATGAAQTALWRRRGRFLAALPDGRIVLRAADGTLRTWHPVGGAEQTLDAPAADGPAAALADGRLALAGTDGTVSLVSVPASARVSAPGFLPAAFDDELLTADFEAARILSAIPEVEGTLDAGGCARLAQPAVPGGEPAVTADDLTARVFFAVVLDQ